MVVAYEPRTWQVFLSTLKREFQDYPPNEEDGRLEWHICHEQPTACDSLDHSYPCALVEVTVRNKRWWNWWRGVPYLLTHLEIYEDWQGGFHTQVRKGRSVGILIRLKRVEELLGVVFRVVQ